MTDGHEKNLIDPYERKIDYLRLSITDRCNLRCTYCMPEEGVKSKTHDEIMRIEEIFEFAKAAVEVGLTRIRLTGGEPLIRRGVVDLIKDLTALPDLKEVSMTTNAILLGDMAEELFEAGLKRVNISIDTLDPKKYKELTRWGSLEKALDGMKAAIKVGMSPVKINVVVLKGVNDDFDSFAKLTYDYPVHVRFIEYMPAFYEEKSDDFVSGQELERRVRAFGEAYDADAPPVEGAGPARYYHLKGAKGTLGVIGTSKGHFCDSCNRVRLTADGKLRTCLFSDRMIDVLSPMREGVGNAGIKEIIRKAIVAKPKDRLIEKDKKMGRKMSQIGG